MKPFGPKRRGSNYKKEEKLASVIKEAWSNIYEGQHLL
jgi:hypothetical protein